MAAKYVARGTRGFSRPCWASEASTKASSPRFSQRKLSQARTVPIARPVAQRRWCASARMAAAVKPNRSVSQAMRCSVAAPATSSATLTILAVAGEAADDFANAGVETKTAEDQHQPRPGVQPAINKKTDGAADYNRANEGERQFEGKSRLRCKIRGLLWCGCL